MTKLQCESCGMPLIEGAPKYTINDDITKPTAMKVCRACFTRIFEDNDDDRKTDADVPPAHGALS